MVKRCSPFALLAGLASLVAACNTAPTCGAACGWNLRFQMARPLAARELTVEVRQPQDASSPTLVTTCTWGDASMSCTPYDWHLNLIFDGAGQLAEVDWEQAPPGSINLTILADGIAAVNKSITYTARTDHEVCGVACQASAVVTVE